MRERIDLHKIQSLMDSAAVDTAIFMSPALGEYFTGLMPAERREYCPEERTMFFVFFRAGESFVVFRNPEISPVGLRFESVPDIYPAGLMLQEKTEVLVKQLKRRRFLKGRIGIEMDYMPVSVKDNLAASFPEAAFVDILPLSRQLMVPKDEYQLSCIEKALAACEKGLQAMFHELRKRAGGKFPIDMRDIYSIYQETLSSYRAQLFGSRWLTDKAFIEHNKLTLFDMVTCYGGYLSDFCIPFYMGIEPPRELAFRSEIAERIIDTVASAVELDMSSEVAEKAIDDRLKRIFGSEYVPLGIESRWLIHGLGIRIHEEPLLGAGYRGKSRTLMKREIQFEKGCVISIEIPYLTEQMYKMTITGLVRMGEMKAKLHTLEDNSV